MFLRLFLLLCHCEECVIKISTLMNMSSPAVSHHLRQLKSIGLITSQRSGIDGELLYQKYCSEASFSSFAGNEETSAIFEGFYGQPEHLASAYRKLKSLELLLYLGKAEPTAEKQLTEYQADQVNLIRQIHEQLLSNLDRRITIEELSRQYLINTTTLKNLFKAVYGTSIAAHIKEHRMEYAAKMLLETQNPIADIAGAVGYDSQSKFTAAFKDAYQMTPREYRKLHG